MQIVLCTVGIQQISSVLRFECDKMLLWLVYICTNQTIDWRTDGNAGAQTLNEYGGKKFFISQN